MIKKIRFCFIVLFMFSSCEDYLMINQTIKAINIMAKNKYQLECFGSGFAGPKLIESFNLSYRTTNNYDINSARHLIIDLTESYIILLNNSSVKFNIANSPINEKNASLSIIFVDNNGDYKTGISSISIFNGYINFYKVDENEHLVKFAKESYSEAYFKVYGTPPLERY